jgi:hypothetical protein
MAERASKAQPSAFTGKEGRGVILYPMVQIMLDLADTHCHTKHDFWHMRRVPDAGMLGLETPPPGTPGRGAAKRGAGPPQ